MFQLAHIVSRCTYLRFDMYLGVHVKDYTLKYAPFSGYQTWQMEESEDITQIYFKTAVLPVPILQLFLLH